MLKRINRFAAEAEIQKATLKDAVALIDRIQSGKGEWTVADVKKLEAIRFLSL